MIKILSLSKAGDFFVPKDLSASIDVQLYLIAFYPETHP